MKYTVNAFSRVIGDGTSVFVVAEMSANHDQSLQRALRLVDLAADAGADAVKVQTYRPESLTLETAHASARVDPIWGADNLFQLYQRAAMPMEFHEPVFEQARRRGIQAFSTVYDEEGVEFLESLKVPAYKIASPEIVHLPLLRKVAATGKPVFLSTGMSNIGEVEEALDVLKTNGASQIVVLHCCSDYPAAADMVNLSAMRTLRETFRMPTGYSDHTLGTTVPIAAVVMGACVIEKHFTDDVSRSGPDHRFSIGPRALAEMVQSIRIAEAVIGAGGKVVSSSELVNRAGARRSLFARKEIQSGEVITSEMLAVVRPGSGLHPRFLEIVIGRTAARDIRAGWPISWEDI